MGDFWPQKCRREKITYPKYSPDQSADDENKTFYYADIAGVFAENCCFSFLKENYKNLKCITKPLGKYSPTKRKRFQQMLILSYSVNL